MRFFCAVLISMLCMGWPAATLHAQWNGRLSKNLRNNSRLVHTRHTPTPVVNRTIAKHVSQATAAAMPRAVQSAVFVVQEKSIFLRRMGVPASAFAIEETYQGKRYVWGVTAAHYGFMQPAIKTAFLKYTPVSIQVKGNSGANDVLLFALPEEIAPQLTPLPLAEESAQPGEEVYSAGFFDNELQYEPHRIVKEVTPLRVITSLVVEPEIDREGACGGPVLNQRGEVVGMHMGSSASKHVGYVVPVSQIREALAVLHTGEKKTPLLFQGQELYELGIEEAITKIEFFYQHQLVRFFLTRHREKEIDYAHLEKFLPAEPVDQLVLTINQQSISTNAASAPVTKTIYYEVHPDRTIKIAEETSKKLQ